VSRAHLQRALRVLQALVDESRRRGYAIREPAPSPNGTREICIAISDHEFAVTISEEEGKLRLWLPRAYGGRRQWNDGPRGLIEGKLGDVLASVEARAREIEEHRRALEEEQRRREEARDRAIQVARERYGEAFRTEVLRTQVADRRLAKDIRAYCHELRQVLGNEDASAEAARWVKWAEAYADAIDPLADTPTMPEVPEPKFEDLRPFLSDAGISSQYWP